MEITGVSTHRQRSGNAAARALSGPLAVHYSSAHAEHYTPRDVLAIVIACLGAIDLDPCSNSKTDPNVDAAEYFTADDDGLVHEWRGRVYMNPPYGREIDKWIAKLLDEFARGRVTEAIALVPARTDTQWFARLRDHAWCFIRGRLTFVGNEDPAPFPSALVYLGDDVGKFYKHVHERGDVWHRMIPLGDVEPVTLPERIAVLEAEIESLKRQQRVALLHTIAIVVGPGVAFSAAELWEHRRVNPDLRDALVQLDVRGPRSLGRRLQQLHDDREKRNPGTVSIERDDEIDHVTLWVVRER